MAVITYTARRSLIGGHSIGVAYQIETMFWARPRARVYHGHQSVTLSGLVESHLYRIEGSYQITSDIVAPANLGLWREFIDSVMNRETFNIDFTGTIAAPGTNVLVRLQSTEIREAEVARQYKQFQFNVVEA